MNQSKITTRSVSLKPYSVKPVIKITPEYIKNMDNIHSLKSTLLL